MHNDAATGPSFGSSSFVYGVFEGDIGLAWALADTKPFPLDVYYRVRPNWPDEMQIGVSEAGMKQIRESRATADAS